MRLTIKGNYLYKRILFMEQITVSIVNNNIRKRYSMFKELIINLVKKITILCAVFLVTASIVCELNPTKPPNYYYGYAEKKVALSSENFKIFRVQNPRGNITVKNSLDDSIRITVKIYTASELSQGYADSYLDLIAAQFDSILATQDTAFFFVYWQQISLDHYCRTDLDVETPKSVDFTVLNSEDGNQTIKMEVPKNNQGLIDAFTSTGNIYFYIPKTASAYMLLSALYGYVVFNNFKPTTTVIRDNSNFEGTINSGLPGWISLTVNNGNIYIIGVDSLSKSP